MRGRARETRPRCDGLGLRGAERRRGEDLLTGDGRVLRDGNRLALVELADRAVDGRVLRGPEDDDARVALPRAVDLDDRELVVVGAAGRDRHAGARDVRRVGEVGRGAGLDLDRGHRPATRAPKATMNRTSSYPAVSTAEPLIVVWPAALALMTRSVFAAVVSWLTGAVLLSGGRGATVKPRPLQRIRRASRGRTPRRRTGMPSVSWRPMKPIWFVCA